MFKYSKGYGKIKFRRHPDIINSERKTRGHTMKLMRRQLTSNIKRYNFLMKRSSIYFY